MKGIVLAGGAGTRLYPLTVAVSKQLLPVYDKPMIYYSLSTLMLAGIRDMLIISTVRDLPNFQHLFGDGSQLGLNITYAEQAEPAGIAQAFIIGSGFIANDDCSLILGDNIFYGHGLGRKLHDATQNVNGATIFVSHVKDPERYGVLEFDRAGKAISIVEKPEFPRSNYAVCGLYLYTNEVVDIARSLKPSLRGELEITDINTFYLESGRLTVEKLGSGSLWLDTGTHEALSQASAFVEAVEQRLNLKIACIEEIAYRQGYIDAEQLARFAHSLNGSAYGDHLSDILEKEI